MRAYSILLLLPLTLLLGCHTYRAADVTVLAPGDAPVPAATIEVEVGAKFGDAPTRTSRTGPDGRATIRLPNDALNHVRVMAPGYEMAYRAIGLPGDDTSHLVIRLKHPVFIPQQRGPRSDAE